MKKTISIWVLAIASLGLVACGEEPNGEANTKAGAEAAGDAKPTASEEPHAHEDGEHSHDGDAGHSHDAPKTEAFYGEDAKNVEGAAAPEETHSDHQDQHQHEHEGGVDDHQH